MQREERETARLDDPTKTIRRLEPLVTAARPREMPRATSFPWPVSLRVPRRRSRHRLGAGFPIARDDLALLLAPA
jgi:hypothetical protein